MLIDDSMYSDLVVGKLIILPILCL